VSTQHSAFSIESSAFSRQASALSFEERQEIVILSEAKDLLFSACCKILRERWGC
jgi:hypothetical protein